MTADQYKTLYAQLNAIVLNDSFGDVLRTLAEVALNVARDEQKTSNSTNETPFVRRAATINAEAYGQIAREISHCADCVAEFETF